MGFGESDLVSSSGEGDFPCPDLALRGPGVDVPEVVSVEDPVVDAWAGGDDHVELLGLHVGAGDGLVGGDLESLVTVVELLDDPDSVLVSKDLEVYGVNVSEDHLGVRGELDLACGDGSVSDLVLETLFSSSSDSEFESVWLDLNHAVLGDHAAWGSWVLALGSTIDLSGGALVVELELFAIQKGHQEVVELLWVRVDLILADSWE